MDMLAVTPQGALVVQGALGSLGHCFSWLCLGRLTFNTRLLGVRAKICRVEAVPCGDEAERSLINGGIVKTPWTRTACFTRQLSDVIL